MRVNKIITERFFGEHNISRSHFAKLIGVSHQTVKKVIAGDNVKEESVNKILAGVIAMENLDFVYPTIQYVRHDAGKKQYEKNKKKSNALDKKFVKAFTKELKNI